MTTAQAIQDTVAALKEFAEGPSSTTQRCFLCVTYGAHNVRSLKVENSISWWQCFLSYFGASRYNLRAIVDFLHADGSFFAKLNESCLRDTDWVEINFAIVKLRSKIDRYNNRGMRPLLPLCRLSSILPLLMPLGVSERIQIAEDCFARIKAIVHELCTKRDLDSDIIRGFYSKFGELRQKLASARRGIEQVDDLVELALAYCSHSAACYQKPYDFISEKGALVQKASGNSLMQAFVGFMDNANVLESSAGKPLPFRERYTVQELREQTAQFFKENLAKDEELRVLIYHAMLQQNRSIEDADKKAEEHLAQELTRVCDLLAPVVNGEQQSVVIEICERCQENNNFGEALLGFERLLQSSATLQPFLSQLTPLLRLDAERRECVALYRYDMSNLPKAFDRYIQHTQMDNRWASLPELYALSHKHRLLVDVYKVGTAEGESGVPVKDTDLGELCKPVDESRACIGFTFMLHFESNGAFTLPESELPLTPRSAEIAQSI